MTTALAGGLVLALLSALALDTAFVLQHHGAARAGALSLRRPLASARALATARRWSAGFVIGLGGWVLYLLALGVAPLSLVQAVAASGLGLLVLGVALARRRWPARREGLAALVATVGLAALGLSLVGAHGASAGAVPALRLGAFVGVTALLALTLSRRGSAAAGGTAAGIGYGIGDLATKAFLVRLPVHAGIGGVLGDPYLGLVLAGHGSGFLLLQQAFRRGGVVAAVAPMTAAMNLLPMLAGVAVLGDPIPASPGLAALRLGAFAATAVGAGLLAWAR